VFAAAGVVSAALVPRVAVAGDGVIVEARARASRVEPLASGPLPVFGAAPARADRAEATFVYLHGVCGLTTNGCGHFEGAPGWLVCPQANHPCANGGSSWSGSVEEKIATVDRALDAARARWPESSGAPVILVGFSQGAYVAMDLARAQPGRFVGLLLLGADTGHASEAFRLARLHRVALACGAYDMMFPRMRATPAALVPAGIEARFASLGEVGHTYVARDGTDGVLTSLLEWVAAGEGAEPAADVEAIR
jgi:pimeloyl-ACP methyl ester carboxylesterase